MTATALQHDLASRGRPALGATLRFAAALTTAAAVTIALFFLMRALIWTETPPPAQAVDAPAITIAEYVAEQDPIRLVVPQPPETISPPPPIEPVSIDPSPRPGVSPNAGQRPTIRAEPDTGSLRPAFMPPPLQIRVAPVYPQRELARGVEGRCVVQYDILANGRTANARTLACDSAGFARAALDAVADWRHAPAAGRDPQSVVQRGVQIRLDFTLDG